MFEEENNESEELEAFRKAIQRRFILEADKLADVLFNIIYEEDTDARSKLSAINIVMDRSLPKMGVQHAKQEESEERGSRKQIREEIERMLRGEEPKDEE